MEPRFRFRLYLLTALVLIGAGTLVTRLYRIQIEEREFYRARIPQPTTVSIRRPGVRGVIVDRNWRPGGAGWEGVVLAENVRNYELVFNLEEIYRDWKRQNSARRPGGGEAPRSAIPTAEGAAEIGKIVSEFIVPRLEKMGVACRYSQAALKSHYITHSGLVPFTFPVDLTYEQFSRLAEHNLEMAGVYVTVRPRRRYPYGTLASHIIGYLKQWEKGDIPDNVKKEFDHYMGDAKGAAGVEATMNEYLVGRAGKKTLWQDEKGIIIGDDDYVRPSLGSRVELTIDGRYQYLVETVLRKAGRVAAVVIDVNSGEILAMASLPNYDPNEFIPSIRREKWLEYNKNRADPLVNRALSSFAPGSTFKLPTAIAGCMNGHTNHRHNCTGGISYGRAGKLRIRCWKRVGHGTLALRVAVQRSCNPYFMSMATDVGTRKMVETFHMLNLGRPTGVRLPAEDPGIVPGSVWWKQEYRPGATLTKSLLAQLAIGQGDSQASPLQMAALVACIANGGKYYQPRIIKQVIHPTKGPVIKDLPELKRDLTAKGITQTQLALIREGMWRAVNEPGGTARRAGLGEFELNGRKIEVAGKTGTAQTFEFGKATHNAWTVAFAPYDAPKYAIAVVVQNGKSGGKVAGPLVHLILRGIFASEGGLSLPVRRLGEVAGNFDPIEEIPLPEGELLSLAIDEDGETGEEASEARQDDPPVKVVPRAIPLPSITPDADSGTSNSSEGRPPQR